MNSRYLTKSRFQLAMECKTKVFYHGKSHYANQNMEDPFLTSLANGGFQVGELAKCYFPGGHNIESLDPSEAIRQTKRLMEKEKVIIYEAAFLTGNLFIRTDILIKSGDQIKLVEVKAKSFNQNTDSFLTKTGKLASSWREYLTDLAFQKYVLTKSLAGHQINAYLMLIDKNVPCPVDGLNQMFQITKDPSGKKIVKVSKDLRPEDLTPQILIELDVDDHCNQLIQNNKKFWPENLPFSEFVEEVSLSLEKDEKIPSPISLACGSCEFRASDKEIEMGLKSGFHKCWKENLGWKEEDFKEDTAFDIWNFRKKKRLIEENRIKLTDIALEDISPKSDGKPGLSNSQRQWLQVEKAQEKDTSAWVDTKNLAKEMKKWKYPLHFIDFETSQPAIPFNKGRRPYEGIAFQFSHHIVKKDGSIEHKGQFLDTEPGVFPNYKFVEALKAELDKDEGTIFRYADHENTYLNIIRNQLLEDPVEHPKKEELCSFIESITTPTCNSRCMVDMCQLIKRFYYNPATKGSNSIKYVLPAMLSSSTYLKEKYSKPIYGSDDGIPSLNFKDWTWISFDKDKQIIDPYKRLPTLFQDLSDRENELLSENDSISDGGAALTAYGKLQYEDMSDYEREEINKALLKYCELDTLAMVMIFEGWKEILGSDL